MGRRHVERRFRRGRSWGRSRTGCAGCRGGSGSRSSSAAVPHAGRLQQRLRPSRRLRHADLHAARARPQRRRRLRAACSISATSRSSASAPTATRCSPRTVRPPLADARRDPGRRDRGAPSRASSSALPSRRLIGDYLAIVTLFFGQLFVDRDARTATAFGPRLHPSYDVTNGPNGIAEHRPVPLFGHPASIESLEAATTTSRSSFFLVVSSAACTSSTTRAPAARGGRCARTRSRPS